ncbi:MFS transporter [Mailhella massiliensis]|uniref:MFS transporter n=1 Tax=Mailhella massiliensis TaxID=1903261 RepID=UPI0023535730|nr:MFS transporter [Mailhella massiliensis]
MFTRLKIVNPVWILALLCTAYSLSFFQRVYPSVLSLDLMKAFSVDTAGFGLISSATMLGYAVTQIPSGLLTDIMGGRRALVLYQILAGLCCMAFTFCESLMPAVVCRFLLGLTLACNVPAYKLLASCVPAERYAQYCSILTGCGAVGTLLASSPLVAVTGLVGWRAALFMVGVFTVLLGGMIYMLLRDGESAGRNVVSMRDNVRELKSGIAVVIRMKNFWFIVLWFMFMIGNLFTLLTAWWGGYLMQANGLSKDMAGLSMSIMSLTPLPFLMVFPWLSDRVVHSRRVFLLLAALLETLVLGYLCLHTGEPLSFVELTVAGVAVSVVSNCMGPLSFTMVKESVPVSALASACGFLNSTGPVVSALMQALLGVLVAWRMGEGATAMQAYGNAFWLLCAGSFISLVAALFMKDTLK